MGGSDWRGLSVSGSRDGELYQPLKNICCYGSGDYKIDTHIYENPFYLKFTLASGACCGENSYVTLSKELTFSNDTCEDSDGGKNYFTNGSISTNQDGDNKSEYKDVCIDNDILEEQYCNDNLQPSSIKYNCADKCSNGKCTSEAGNDSKLIWQEGRSGTVKDKKIETKNNILKISFRALSVHPYTGYAYLVSAAPYALSNKKITVETELDQSVQKKYYDEHGPTFVLSPEKYFDADLRDDEADNSDVHFTTALRCFTNLNDVNNGKITYGCQKRENGKTTELFTENIEQGIKDTKAELEFDFQSNKIIVKMKTPKNSHQYIIEDASFVSKLLNSYIYLGGASSSDQVGSMILENLTVGDKILDILFDEEKTLPEKNPDPMDQIEIKPIEEMDINDIEVSQYCIGCLFEKNICIPIGTVVNIENKLKYCSFLSTFEEQKEIGAACQNNYECKTNMCVNEICYDIEKEMKETRNLLERIIDMLKSLIEKLRSLLGIE